MKRCAFFISQHLNLLFCFCFVIGVSCKYIYVSKNQASKDDLSCGLLYQPCCTLAYALLISHDSDIIKLDASYEFNQNKPLTINKRLTICSYQSAETLKSYASIKFSYLLRVPFMIELSEDVYFENVEIYYDGRWGLFYIGSNLLNL